MQDLRLIGVHEDGQHLLLGAEDGTQFRVPLGDELRAAVRRARPGQGQAPADAAGELRPRDVQALIRAGASAEEVAEQAGWPVEKVHRYEGPIVAEREHVASLARGVRVRGRAHGGVAPTLGSRVTERLAGRGVDPSRALWDAHRTENGPWTVVVTFPAGGRERQARWHLDVPDRTITSLDDEARWLSGDDDAESAGPLPAPHVPPTGRSTRVYDVEAEGGLRATPRTGEQDRSGGSSGGAGSSRAGSSGAGASGAGSREEPVDLMTAMRERSAASRASRRSRRRGSRRSPADVPGDQQPPEDALPLEQIPYETVTADVPPAAHADPDPDGPDGTPEPEAREEAEPAAGGEPGAEPAAREGTDAAEHDSPEGAHEDEVAPDEESADEESAAGESSAASAAEPDVEPTAEASDRAPAADQASAEHQPTAETQDEATSAPAAERGVEGAAERGAEGTDAGAPKRNQGKRRSGRKRGRPSVPSWDDIMFGSRPGPD